MEKQPTVIEQMFNVKDERWVSKDVLMKRVVMQDGIIRHLFEELFFADPYHSTFRGMPEKDMAPLRTRAILRKEGLNECKN